MKTTLLNGRLLIEPETDFEADWLYSTYPQGTTHKAYVKTGIDVGDRLGIVILFEGEGGDKK